MDLPNLKYEKILWNKNYHFVAGLDEVGRGSLAGPVVTGCVVFDRHFATTFKKSTTLQGVRVDDSKKLTNLQRQKADRWIKDNCLAWGIGVGSVAEINRKKISKTTASGFRRAIANAQSRGNLRIDYLLIDAFYIPYTRGLRMPLKRLRKRLKQKKNIKTGENLGNQLAIVNGDCKSVSIAAASIIAKVYRDRLMAALGKKLPYRKYRWDKNKGYGTRLHLAAIRKYGVTRHHRRDFVKKIPFKRSQKPRPL
jgi:ribonuclease HII